MAEGLDEERYQFADSSVPTSRVLHSTMKSALALVLMSLATLAVASHSHDTVHRRCDNNTDNTTGCTGSYFQKPKGKASFTSADNCVTPCKLCPHFMVQYSTEPTLSVMPFCSVRRKHHDWVWGGGQRACIWCQFEFR